MLKKTFLFLGILVLALFLAGCIKTTHSLKTSPIKVCKTSNTTPYALKLEQRTRRGWTQGSGWATQWRGEVYIITNYHVVDEDEWVDAYMEDGTHINAHVLHTNPKHDIAILKPTSHVNRLRGITLQLSFAQQENKFIDVFMRGFPTNGLWQHEFTYSVPGDGKDGLIFGINEQHAKNVVEKGVSGSAIVNCRTNKVVGMASKDHLRPLKIYEKLWLSGRAVPHTHIRNFMTLKLG